MSIVDPLPEPAARDRHPLHQVFAVFVRLGASAFGGPAMVPFVKRRIVDQLGWLSAGEFREGLALCQVVPGATTMQLAGWIGLRVGGLSRAGVAFIAFGLPPVGLMIALAAAYQQWGETWVVVAVFAGLQAVVVSILVKATTMFARSSIRTWRHITIGVVAAALVAIEVHPLWVVVGSAALAGALGPDNATTRGRLLDTPRRHTWQLVAIVVVAFAAIGVLAMVSPRLADLGLLMGRIDLFAFGGGFASLPLMYHEVLARHWMPAGAFLDGVALGQITPGPIVITAVFVGYVVFGIGGAIVAAVAIFLPSFVIVAATAPRIDQLRSVRRFDAIISGLSASFVGLLAVSTVKLAIEVPWDIPRVVVSLAALAALAVGAEIVWVVLAAALIGVALLR